MAFESLSKIFSEVIGRNGDLPRNGIVDFDTRKKPEDIREERNTVEKTAQKEIDVDKRITGKKLTERVTEVNGYKYTIDKHGRTITAEGKLKLMPETKRNQKMQSEAGGKDRLKTDDGGHPIGRQFGGEGKLDLVAQDKILNRGPYNRLESKWAEALKNGDNVSVKVDMKYPGNSMRPDSFRVTYTINGEKFKTTFSNKPNAYAK